MFGWEFPPHIFGGLGTASYGLTEGLAEQPGVDEISFVVPHPYGDEEATFVKIIGADTTPIVYKDVTPDQIQAHFGPRTTPDEYYRLRKHLYADFRYRYTDSLGCIPFAGGYPNNLLEEINNYSIVAGVIARATDFDIIHAHDWVCYPAGIHAKAISGKPLVIHVHATDFDRSRGNVNPEVFRIELDGMNHADHIVTVSDLTRRTVIDKYHQSPDKVTTVHNAVTPLSKQILELPDKRGVKDKVVTFLGRITMQKGPEYFVEAAAKVLRNTQGVRFVMAGNGDMMDSMIRLVAQRRIADRFHFTGFMKGREVYEIYKASDVYVMPSVSEPFGISPLEAMQCGVPSIISVQSGCAEILRYALKVDYWDVDALANAIHSVIAYPSLHHFLKEKGLEEVNNIKWYDAGRKLSDIYSKLLSNR